ncbi:prevent-host-death protein [Hydrogenophaga sp. YM1]|mgnify:CR=1 FL=1|uniref:YlcI/YnfO family protein n=1 Tax=Hydrogenophaga sp. YM1 TaxID=2806262 RepID=UPI00195E8AE5|nr:YlcI/YnfO family protein [Hydrogenophaga sp. YM1]QRR33912.1 prevent-host-death protein [Hydrogenophaga sp. YM1]
MRSASLPPIRVEPEFRQQLEEVLAEGETLSSLVEHAVRQELMRRMADAEFHQRGFASLARAKETGNYLDADEVLSRLDDRLRAAKASSAR